MRRGFRPLITHHSSLITARLLPGEPEEPTTHAFEQRRYQASIRRRMIHRDLFPGPVLHETDGRGIHWMIDGFRETTDTARTADPYWHLEDALGDLGRPIELRPASGQDEPCRNGVFHPNARDLLPDEREKLRDPRL